MDARWQIAAGSHGASQSRRAIRRSLPRPLALTCRKAWAERAARARYEDMLQNPHDEDLFEFYATSQLALVDSVSGQVSPIGKPAIITAARMSPDGKDFIVTTIHRPFSYSYPARQFPTEIEAWDRTGKALHKLASIPLGGGGRAARRPSATGAAPADDDPGPAERSAQRDMAAQRTRDAHVVRGYGRRSWWRGRGGRWTRR